MRDPSIALEDCLTEIAILKDMARDFTFSTFQTDPLARRAASYAIQTISEAVRHFPKEGLAEFDTIPWADVIAIGNRIRHENFRIDDAILWNIATSDVLSLEIVIRTILARHRIT